VVKSLFPPENAYTLLKAVYLSPSKMKGMLSFKESLPDTKAQA
jgi:hypothetical protein